mgnify:CR=1 FL=1
MVDDSYIRVSKEYFPQTLGNTFKSSSLTAYIEMIGSKWRHLVLGAKWDRTIVPIFEAAGRSRCIPLFKTLLSNRCSNDCLYCMFRRDRSIERCRWDPEKLIKVALYLVKKRYVRGVFLSSSVDGDPDKVTEEEILVAEELRRRGYRGYIHLRIMPGTSRHLIYRAAEVADRIGVNIESPVAGIFYSICPDKGSYRNDILKRLEYCYRAYRDLAEKRMESGYGYLRSGVITQMIIGLGETDVEVLETTHKLITEYGLRRVYYSPFTPIHNTPLENKPPCVEGRDYTLYQAFYLMKYYGFRLDELLDLTKNGMLPKGNLKKVYAEQHRYLYPIDLNNASYWDLIRMPGVGPRTARKILNAVNEGHKIRDFRDLEKIVGYQKSRKIMKYVRLSP